MVQLAQRTAEGPRWSESFPTCTPQALVCRPEAPNRHGAVDRLRVPRQRREVRALRRQRVLPQRGGVASHRVAEVALGVGDGVVLAVAAERSVKGVVGVLHRLGQDTNTQKRRQPHGGSERLERGALRGEGGGERTKYIVPYVTLSAFIPSVGLTHGMMLRTPPFLSM